jgi:hypothetical protein
MLIVEVILAGCVKSTGESKDEDPLATALTLHTSPLASEHSGYLMHKVLLHH